MTVARSDEPLAPSGDATWGYGRYGEDQLFPLSHDDIRHDTAAATRALRGLGLPDRSIILLLAKVADVGHLHPVQEAARQLGHVVANADASAMDSGRVAMFTRLLPIAAVIGVNDEMVDGMEEGGVDPRTVFSEIPVVLALGSAHGRLAGMGMDPWRLELLGPALALECRYRRLHVDGLLWSVQDKGGRLQVSSLIPRALVVQGFDTHRHGTVSEAVCPCGRSGPVIELSSPGRAGGRG